MTNQDTTSIDEQIDKVFFSSLRGKTVTPEQHNILLWAERQLKPAIKALISDQVAKARIANTVQVLDSLVAIDELDEPFMLATPTTIYMQLIEARATLNGVKK